MSMCGIQLDRRISIVVDVGRYIMGVPITTMGIYSYVGVFMGNYSYEWVYIGVYGYVWVCMGI